MTGLPACCFSVRVSMGSTFSVQLPMGRWNEPGPGVFPFTLSLLLLISGAAWFIRGKRGKAEKREGEKAGGFAFIRNPGDAAENRRSHGPVHPGIQSGRLPRHIITVPLHSPSVGIQLSGHRFRRACRRHRRGELVFFCKDSCRSVAAGISLFLKGFRSLSSGGFPWMS